MYPGTLGGAGGEGTGVGDSRLDEAVGVSVGAGVASARSCEVVAGAANESLEGRDPDEQPDNTVIKTPATAPRATVDSEDFTRQAPRRGGDEGQR